MTNKKLFLQGYEYETAKKITEDLQNLQHLQQIKIKQEVTENDHK